VRPFDVLPVGCLHVAEVRHVAEAQLEQLRHVGVVVGDPDRSRAEHRGEHAVEPAVSGAH